MAVAPVIAAAALVAVAVDDTQTLPYAVPLAALWSVSPLVAWWLSRPIPPPTLQLSENQHQFLEKLSRKTWRYFEEFVTAADNWLPPDNIQQNPELVIASRTSPTNIGMALLADLAAYDFGYCSAAQLLQRTQRTFATLSRLERYRGHFFNWYDTRSLAPLHPRYVSMVDSGNLAAICWCSAAAARRCVSRTFCRRACSAACAIRSVCCWSCPAEAARHGAQRRSCAGSNGRSKNCRRLPRR